MFSTFKNSIFIFIITLYFSCIGHNAFGFDAKTIKLATGEYPPYASAEMPGYGCVTEIVSATLKEMGVTPDYIFYPWKRCERTVELGKIWATFPYSVTEKRTRDFLFSDVLLVTSTNFFFYKKRTPKFKWDTLADLKPYTIGGVLGYYYKAEFEKAKLIVDYAPSETMTLKKLIHDRVALAPLDEAVGWNLIKKHFPEELINIGMAEKAHETSGNYLMVSKSYPDSENLLNRFNNALNTIKHNGIMTMILKKYNISM